MIPLVQFLTEANFCNTIHSKYCYSDINYGVVSRNVSSFRPFNIQSPTFENASLFPEQNRKYYADDIFMDENVDSNFPEVCS